MFTFLNHIFWPENYNSWLFLWKGPEVEFCKMSCFYRWIWLILHLKNKYALKVINVCWFVHDTLFYNYLPSIIRQATKLRMNTLLCDCQLFYTMLNIFISAAIVCVIKLLLFNKLISQLSLGSLFEIWLRAKIKLNCVVSDELPRFGGLQISVTRLRHFSAPAENTMCGT